MRLVALLAVIALVGCDDITAPDIVSSPAPASATSPIALTTSVSSSVLAPGDSVTITITVTNVADTTVTIGWGLCSSLFVVSTRSGRAVGPDVAGLVCPPVLFTATLAPNESMSLPATWSGMLSGAVSAQETWYGILNGGMRGRIPAGNYLVRGGAAFGPVRSNAAAELTVLP